MFYKKGICGGSLPPMTLCLTFDDGPGSTRDEVKPDPKEPGSKELNPGPQTYLIAEYLKNQGIQATFFFTGRHAAQYPDILAKVKESGHLIGNHTFGHPHLPSFLARKGALYVELLRADAIVEPWVDGKITFFRSPYGDWSPELYQALNNTLALSMSHIGPIGWDIDGADWLSWQNWCISHDPNAEQGCADNYLNAIRQAGDKGIILMHDSIVDRENTLIGNHTFQMLQLLIPQLKQMHYHFVRLDEIPDIVSRMNDPFRFALKASNGKYISPQDGGGTKIMVDSPKVGPRELLGIKDLGFGKVALRAPDSRFFSPHNGGGGAVFANAADVYEWEPLDLITIDQTHVAFRTVTGNWLTWTRTSDGDQLVAYASLYGPPEEGVFTVEVLECRHPVTTELAIFLQDLSERIGTWRDRSRTME
jgi:peptidoglycan/xylan/chitin deacetylase (PgdA/CDA1 family)